MKRLFKLFSTTKTFLKNNGLRLTLIKIFEKIFNTATNGYFRANRLGNIGEGELVIAAESTFGLKLPISKEPLLSVLVALYRPNEMKIDILKKSFLKIKEESNAEFLIFLNGSGKEQIKELIDSFPNLRFLESNDNIGFSKAIDRLSQIAKGELLLIHNDDAFIESGLEKMIETIKNEKVAAVVPKIFFKQKFLKFNMLSEDNKNLEILTTSSDDLDVKVFPENEKKTISLEKGVIREIFISENVRDIVLSSNSRVKARIYHENQELAFKDLNKFNISKYFIDFNQSQTYTLINNAGSRKHQDGTYSDLGIYQTDNGKFGRIKELNAVCGCMLLLKRNALFNHGPFEENFFAYYEDSYLSEKISKLGAKMIFDPRCVVSHYHKMSSNRSSKDFSINLTLNKFMLESKPKKDLLGTDSFLLNLSHIYKYHNNFSIATRKNYLRIKDECHKMLYSGDVINFGIFNEWWDSAGGGEKHALDFVDALKNKGQIDLLSFKDFDIKNLESRFSVDLSMCRKKIIGPYSINTMGYDIFINASYRSSLNSFAHKNYYVLSFALDNFDTDISEYHFLANSEYTLRWSQDLMPYNDSQYSLLHPCNSKSFDLKNLKKEKSILTIGRIHKPGNQHNKNFELMIDSFKKLNNDDYHLNIVGSCNLDLKDDRNYLKKLKRLANNENINIYENLDEKELNDILCSSSIYWHAAGYGCDVESEPHKFEHFGIAPIEAASAGTIPIVFNIGGPFDNFKSLKNWGPGFESQDELIEKTNQAIALDKKKEELIRSELIELTKKFSKKSFISDAEKIFFG